MSDIELRDQLKLIGAPQADIDWLESIGWSDAAVPEATAENAADYQRRESLLNQTLKAETFAERGASPAGRLAAAIGARLADLRDNEEQAQDPDEA